MEIKYLRTLSENLTLEYEKANYTYKVEPMAMDEILNLESLYNQGRLFPIALRELLLLAGESCYVLDYGWEDTRQDMQEAVRAGLIEYNRTINRPFFALEVFNGTESFLFVYLDENVDDPTVYLAFLPTIPNRKNPWLESIGKKLSGLLSFRINRLLNSYNPY